MTFVHPDYRCPGCDRPIEPLAQVRAYHTQCDPQGRVEMLEREIHNLIVAIGPFAQSYAPGMERAKASTPIENRTIDHGGLGRLLTVGDLFAARFALNAARAALAHKPAQMEGREG